MEKLLNKFGSSIVLVGVMALTRFHHFGDSLSLPDASVAVFFLGGLWVGGIKLFSLLLIEAGLIDYLAITQFGVSDFCISSAYIFLIPAYAAVWFGGRYSSRCSSRQLTGLLNQFGLLLLTTSSAFLISNGSFFLLSDKHQDGSWVQYIEGITRYYPPYLMYTLFYVVSAYVLLEIYHQIKLLKTETELPRL